MILSFLVIVTILALATMITMIIQLFQSMHFSLRTVKDHITDDIFDDGVFDLGTWACETKDLPSFASFYSLAQQCGLSSALRVSTVFQFLLTSSLLTIVWWDKRVDRQLFVERRYI